MAVSHVQRAPREARSRALLKTAGYRLVMLAITFVVAWLVVGDVAQAASIGVAANVLKTGTYYAYERLWARITWGLAGADATG